MLEGQQTQNMPERASRLMGLTHETNCELTTFDRDTGAAHEVTMWFAADGDTIYMLSDNSGDTDWVRNILSNPEVSLRIGNATFAGMARVVVNHPDVESDIRQMLFDKYADQRDTGDVSKWSSDALPVAIDLQP